MAEIESSRAQAAGKTASLTRLTNMAGAAMSLALVIGIGVWGYKLLVRDVSGVPVVRAAEGPMRVQPDNPGGRQALHQGLSVNGVAAKGGAADPADRLVLAPAPLELSLDDAPVKRPVKKPLEKPANAAAKPTIAPRSSDDGANPALTAEDRAVHLASMQVLADKLSDGIAPLEDMQPAPDAEPGAAAEPAVATPPKVTGGLGRSLRPQVRPAGLSRVQPAAATATAPQEVSADTLATGTRLAQLGAFESAEIARKEWDRLSAKFGEYLDGKQRVVQKAQSGGRTFYRLRAMGFDDLNDARRFCSALVAEQAECIPVVTR